MNETYKLTLDKPFAYEGEEWTAMEFDFGKLTGKDAMEIENEMDMRGMGPIQNEATDGMYQILAASKASGIAEDVLKALPLKKNMAIKRAARRYLINGSSALAEELQGKLEEMSGAEAEIIENELRAEGYVMVNIPAADTKFCTKLAARGLDKTEKELGELPMDEFLNIKMAVRFFLIGVV